MAHAFITFILTLYFAFASANGFWLSSSTNNNVKKPADTRAGGAVGQYAYSTRDSVQPQGPVVGPLPAYSPWLPAGYSFDSPMTVALPVAVPVQAQVRPSRPPTPTDTRPTDDPLCDDEGHQQRKTGSEFNTFRTVRLEAMAPPPPPSATVQLVPCLCPVTPKDQMEPANAAPVNYVVQAQPVQTAP